MTRSCPIGSYRVVYAGGTHVGMRRVENEDAYLVPEGDRIAIVADGMGGHAAGEVASRLAVESIADNWRASADEPPASWPYPVDYGHRHDERRLVQAVCLANSRIFEAQQLHAEQQGMGTTVVSVLFSVDGVIVGHVGDSRGYLVRDGRMELLTEDHSLINHFIQMRRLDRSEVDGFAHKNVIVRALGMKDAVQVDVRRVEMRAGDLYLLCTDGLTGMVEDARILDILRREPDDLDRACERLIDAANRSGGVDNITAVLARVEGG